jgi:hypothetical protein
MEALLVVITLVSLAMTIVLGAMLVRLMRDERRRSDARVAVLRDMADMADMAGAAARHQEALDPVRTAPARATPPIEPNVRWESYATSELDPDDLDLAPARADGASARGDLFVRPDVRSAWPRRLAVAASILLVATVALVALRPRSSASGSTSGIPPRAASAQAPGLLELLSLKQAQDTGTLTITGLVQNPRDGQPLSKIVAIALLFGADGTFLATGRAPLDFTVLRPGDESSFVISVPVSGPVARYRVGFRSDDGRVIGHVDRRSSGTMADVTAAPAGLRGPS